jgi:hypothetical protein
MGEVDIPEDAPEKKGFYDTRSAARQMGESGFGPLA